MRFIWLLIFVVLICSSCKQKINMQTCYMYIEFYGAKYDFHNKAGLTYEVNDSLNNKIDSLYSVSKRKYRCRIRPVLWEADVFCRSDSDKKYLFTVSSNDEGELFILYGNNCRENPELSQLIYRLVNVDSIREHDGPLNQEEYEKLIME